MNETLTKLQTVTAAGGETYITFSNIPQNYTDLKIFASVRGARTGAPVDNLLIGFNGTYTNVTSRSVYASGSGAAASGTNANWVGIVPSSDSSSSTAYTYSNTEIYIPNYTSSNYKSFSSDSVSEYNGTTAYTLFEAGLWPSSAPITSISLKLDVTPGFVQYSEFALYGIKNTTTIIGNSIKAIGGTITTDGTYVYHTFNTSGSFIPNTRLFADYLVIAGGGGSGASGAGAGGLRSTIGTSGGGASPESQIQLLPGTSYSVVVGAGGSGSSNGQSSNGSNGNNSSFATITAIGGGGGISSGGSQLNTGLTGGSGSGGYGGGDGTSNGSSAPGGSGTLGQGYAGGSSAPKASATSSSGGGGGAGAVGANAATTNIAGAGGNGVYLSGFSVATNTGLGGYYAGGGGGGYYVNGAFILGGLGGGGAGSSANAPGSSGTSNTGGGAGGAYSEAYKTAAYSGGSGLVIVRYKA
jgi:hypothetical protein